MKKISLFFAKTKANLCSVWKKILHKVEYHVWKLGKTRCKVFIWYTLRKPFLKIDILIFIYGNVFGAIFFHEKT